MKLEQRCRGIRMILCDVDGVLTDGGVVIDNQGIETKQFHIRDGLGIRLWQRAGHLFGVITGRNSHIVQLRSAELDITLVRQGVEDKLAAAEHILQEQGWEWESLCFIGDDLPDLPVIQRAGLGVAVADAAPEVRASADNVCEVAGGRGAVRATIETILKHQQRWDELTKSYHLE